MQNTEKTSLLNIFRLCGALMYDGEHCILVKEKYWGSYLARTTVVEYIQVKCHAVVIKLTLYEMWNILEYSPAVVHYPFFTLIKTFLTLQ